MALLERDLNFVGYEFLNQRKHTQRTPQQACRFGQGLGDLSGRGVIAIVVTIVPGSGEGVSHRRICPARLCVGIDSINSRSGGLACLTELFRSLLRSGIKEDSHPIFESKELP